MIASAPLIYIVIPAYNEGSVVRRTVQSLKDVYEIVVVDDASDNNTANAVRDLRIHYLRHEINLGQGAALQTGMDYARQRGADIAVHFDADGQHNPDNIARFIDVLQTQRVHVLDRAFYATKIVGRTYAPPGAAPCGPHGQWLITGIWLYAHNGFRVMNRKALQIIRLKENRGAATEILMQIRRQRLVYTESPSHIIYTDYSQRKANAGRSVEYLSGHDINKYLR